MLVKVPHGAIQGLGWQTLDLAPAFRMPPCCFRLGPPGLFPGPPLYPARAPVQQQIFKF